MKNAAGGAGTKDYMSVTLTACKETKPKSTCEESDDVYSSDHDGDNYANYAGPVRVYTGKSHCVKLDRMWPCSSLRATTAWKRKSIADLSGIITVDRDQLEDWSSGVRLKALR